MNAFVVSAPTVTALVVVVERGLKSLKSPLLRPSKKARTDVVTYDERELAKTSSKLAELTALAKPGSEEAELIRLTKQVVDQAVKANRRAMTVAKELRLPQGTIVISPATGSYGVIGKDGMIDPASVKPLNPHELDRLGVLFYTPSGTPTGSDGSGQSLIGPGFVNSDGTVVGKSGRAGLAAAIVDAQRSVRGAGSLAGVVKQAQADVNKAVVLK